MFCYLEYSILFCTPVAIIGGGLLYVIVPHESHGRLGVVQITPVSPLVGFGVELLMTLAVTLTVLSCTEGGQTTVDHPASIVIGLVVTACHLFAVIKMLLGNIQYDKSVRKTILLYII